MKRNVGFTLVELLVVIAIIGVLVGLLLPAVQSVREAGRRLQCANNMKQIGLALQNYESVWKTFPMGSVFTNTAPYNRKGTTWVAALFPYMELQNLYDLYNPEYYMNSAQNQDFVRTPVKNLICPSDAETENGIVENRYNFHNINPKIAMGIWYSGSLGPTHMDAMPFCSEKNPSYCNQGYNFGSMKPDDNTVGAFGRYPKGKRLKEFTDGLSNTLV